MRRTVPHKLSLAFIHIHIYMYALRSCCQAIKRSAKQEENPLFTVPDRCRVIVPCEIVSGQITTTASRNLLFWQQFAQLWKGLPVLDAALHVFLTLPGHTSIREDEGQSVGSAAMRLPVTRQGSQQRKETSSVPSKDRKRRASLDIVLFGVRVE